MKLKSAVLVVAGTAAAASAAIAVPTLTSAQTPAPATITVNERVRTVVRDDVAPKSKAGRVSTGDRLITRQSVFDASKKRLGTLYTDCTGVGRTASFLKATLLCTLTYSLPAGQIVAAGNFKLDGSGEIPIVGGTGAYVGAGGVVKSAQPAEGFDSADTIVIGG